MADLSILIAVARNALIHVLGLAPDDTVLVVTDESRRRIGEAFHAAAAGLGCPARLFTFPESARPLCEAPPELVGLLDDVTIVVNALQARNDEIPFRVAWLQRIGATGRIRCGHSPGITEEMFENGPLAVDYGAMVDTAGRLVAAFEGAISARITAPGGTDLSVGLFGRPFVHDCRGGVETMVNLPCGEIYAAPVESDAEGILVADGSIGALGPPPQSGADPRAGRAHRADRGRRRRTAAGAGTAHVARSVGRGDRRAGDRHQSRRAHRGPHAGGREGAAHRPRGVRQQRGHAGRAQRLLHPPRFPLPPADPRRHLRGRLHPHAARARGDLCL